MKNSLVNIVNFLAAESGSTGGDTVINEAYKSFLNVVNLIFPIVLGVLLVFGMIYSIILGVNYARAEDTEKREEAKKRLVGAIVGIVIGGVLVAIIWAILANVDLSTLFKFNEGTNVPD